MTTIDANGIIRYEDTDGAPTPPVLNLGLQSVSDALNGVRRRGIYPVANESERAALVQTVSSQGNPVSSTNPLYVRRANALMGMELEFTLNGTDWQAVPGGDSGWVACADSPGFTATGLYLRRIGAEIHVKGTVVPTGSGVLGSTPVRIAYLPGIARIGSDRTPWPGVSNVSNSNVTFQIFPSTGTIFVRQLAPNTINYTTNSQFTPSGWLDLP